MKVLFRFFSFGVFALSSMLVAAETFSLRPNDVIAVVGGEDMAIAAESGYLEQLVVRAFPAARIKFRSLAWEADTVFERTRDLHYPTLEQQLDEIGATVVITQFGQMESLAGAAKLADFVTAYEKWIARCRAGGKRKVVLITPTPVSRATSAASRFAALDVYIEAIRGIAQRQQLPALLPVEGLGLTPLNYRDGLHLNASGQQALAVRIARTLGVSQPPREIPAAEEQQLLTAIQAKNRMWFHYTRPQNWAFLNGDRTVQPSSRDHLDPEKRWFPEEMKQWLPLIEAKEREIWKLARRGGAK